MNWKSVVVSVCYNESIITVTRLEDPQFPLKVFRIRFVCRPANRTPNTEIVARNFLLEELVHVLPPPLRVHICEVDALQQAVNQGSPLVVKTVGQVGCGVGASKDKTMQF